MTHRKPGRPAEGRKKVSWYVMPVTVRRVRQLINSDQNTPGKVIDRQFKKATSR